METWNVICRHARRQHASKMEGCSYASPTTRQSTAAWIWAQTWTTTAAALTSPQGALL
jgi:hypothetical protein